MVMAYVVNRDGKPLMPCKPKVIKKTPLTIKLSTPYTQNLTLGIDKGSSKIGSPVATDDNGVVYYLKSK